MFSIGNDPVVRALLVEKLHCPHFLTIFSISSEYIVTIFQWNYFCVLFFVTHKLVSVNNLDSEHCGPVRDCDYRTLPQRLSCLEWQCTSALYRRPPSRPLKEPGVSHANSAPGSGEAQLATPCKCHLGLSWRSLSYSTRAIGWSAGDHTFNLDHSCSIIWKGVYANWALRWLKMRGRW